MTVLAMTIALWCAGAPAEAESTVLDAMAAAYAKLDTLEARLIQVNSYPQLGLSDPPEEGLLQVARTGDGVDFRLEMTKPERRVLVVRNGAYTFYQPRIKQAIIGQADKSGGSGRSRFLKYLLGDVSEAEQDFHVEVVHDGASEVADRATSHVRLLPRNAPDSYYTSIDLWVDDELGLPVREKLVEPNGDEVLIRLEQIRLNASPDGFCFDLELPDDVERVRE